MKHEKRRKNTKLRSDVPVNAWDPELIRQKMGELYRKAAADAEFRNLCLQDMLPTEKFSINNGKF